MVRGFSSVFRVSLKIPRPERGVSGQDLVPVGAQVMICLVVNFVTKLYRPYAGLFTPRVFRAAFPLPPFSCFAQPVIYPEKPGLKAQA